jgi:Family of unknown function (DUF5675)
MLLLGKIIFFCLLLSSGLLNSIAQNAHEIEIERKFSSGDCVSGYLFVDGEAICYVLERPWEHNAPAASSIPLGTYVAKIRVDGPKRWRVELQGVPGRGNVQIHIGNTIADSIGCLLPGLRIQPSLCEVRDSAGALRVLEGKLKDFNLSSNDSTITVRVSDGGAIDQGWIFTGS